LLIRSAENTIYRLPHGVVARVSRQGQIATSAKELAVGRWLERCGLDAVRPLHDLEQPVEVDGQAVTWWHELPPHAPGSSQDVAIVLRQLHHLSPPTALVLPPLDPFVRIGERVESASSFSEKDRDWLRQHLATLKSQYTTLPPGLSIGVVHGDAWGGNIAITKQPQRRVLLDFERVSIGPPEWDLIQTALRVSSFGLAPAEEHTAFVASYGHDVTTWMGFSTLRDIRELRMTTMAAQMATAAPAKYHEQAAHRLACIRGARGPRPWSGWTPVS
jgi:aminoglycoside phosphotransferase (APT) family kinase protein